VFEPVIVPGRGEDPTPDILLGEIGAWVRSAPLRALVSRFGDGHPTGSLAEELAYLDDFTAAAWDFRRADSGPAKERNQVDADAITGRDEEFVLAATQALGLARPLPPKYERYDHVVILGGLVRANIWRSQYAAHLLGNVLSAEDVTAISAYRELARNDTDPGKDERALLGVFGLPPREYEWEVMEDGLRRAFGAPPLAVERESEPGAQGPQRFRVASARLPELTLYLVVAPALEPGRRANTADGYRYWAEQVGHVKPGDRVLAVTTPIYVPYQHAVALALLGLPFGCSIDTVGIDFDVIDTSQSPQAFRAVHYLLETRSALRGYRHLVAMLEAAGARQ
jgi:hypothetical protein